MSTALVAEHEADLFIAAEEIRECFLDISSLVKCVPGAVLIAVHGTLVDARIRVKKTAVPTQYALTVRCQRIPNDVYSFEGEALDRRTGKVFPFRVHIALETIGAEQTLCRTSVWLDDNAVDSTSEEIVDRLLAQFSRRLEDVVIERAGAAEWDDEGEVKNVSGRGTAERLPRLTTSAARAKVLVTAGVQAGRSKAGRIAKRLKYAVSRR